MSRGPRERGIVQEFAGYISSRDKGGMLSVLKRMKEDEKILDGFINNGGVDLIVRVLRVPNTKILDYALSILANAFLKTSVREETKISKLSSNIVWILENLPGGQTLHCRACRLVGNMCRSKHLSAFLCSSRILPALSSILTTESTPQTHVMAIRAIKNIWDSHPPSQLQIIDCQMIEEIMKLFVSASTKYESDSTQIKFKDLTEICLKALKSFLESQDTKIIQQIKSPKNFQCILNLCKLNNRISIQIYYKLSSIPENRPDLGNCGGVEWLIDFLKNIKRDSSSNTVFWEASASLCLFSREAVNRARIRDSGGLQVMLGLLEDERREGYHPMLLHALTQFVYDEESVRIMIGNGIVGVLVGRLNRMVLDVRTEEENLEKSGRKRNAEAMSPGANNKIVINRSGRFSLDFLPNQWSPCSANSPTSSPSNSPPLPSSELTENDEENYSPVCSDTEDFIDNDDTKSTSNKEEIDSLSSFVCTSISQDDREQSEKDEDDDIDPVLNSEVNLSHMWTLALLTKLTFWSDPIDGLADANTIQALTAYIEKSKNCKAPLILNRIINNHIYFRPLLLQGFVFEAQSMYNFRDYLEIFSKCAESGGAFGEISAILRRGCEEQKFIVALSVPFILKSREKLRTLLTKYGGLELIFQLLADQNHLLNENSILSICQLAEALGIAPTTRCSSGNDKLTMADDVFHIIENWDDVDETEKQSKRKRRKNESNGESNNHECLVTFELDDGGTVEASRIALCRKSEAFTAMLEGKFFEAGQTKIRLQNVSTDGLSVLCLAASGKLFTKTKRELAKLKIEALLDAVLLADKFLMFEESESLTETSMAKLSHKNLSRAWNWARTNGCSELKICCVKNFLTSRATRQDRLRSFKDFSDDCNFREFLNDVRTIIIEELSIR